MPRDAIVQEKSWKWFGLTPDLSLVVCRPSAIGFQGQYCVERATILLRKYPPQARQHSLASAPEQLSLIQDDEAGWRFVQPSRLGDVFPFFLRLLIQYCAI